jgi:hypothetical protein
MGAEHNHLGKELTMKRVIAFGVIIAAAAVPVVFGLAGNASFAESVPVRIPANARVVDDNGGLTRHTEPGDDKGGLTRHTEPGDDKGGLTPHTEPGDDKGGLTPHTEPGDDKGGLTPHTEPGDDKGGSGSSGGHGGDDGSGHQ